MLHFQMWSLDNQSCPLDKSIRLVKHAFWVEKRMFTQHTFGRAAGGRDALDESDA